MAEIVKKASSLPVISGPWVFWDGSVELEWLQPDEPALDASVIMRARVKARHPLSEKGKGHPLTPPVHLHFDQCESFKILSGQLGTTTGWEMKDRIWRPNDEIHEIKPWVPHTFWPVSGATEDCVALIWAHPKDTPQAMDVVWFEQTFRFLSDAHAQRKMPDVFQMFLFQNNSGSAMVVFPRAWWLGPLRWWVPWMLESTVAAMARIMGYGLVPYGNPKEEAKKR